MGNLSGTEKMVDAGAAKMPTPQLNNPITEFNRVNNQLKINLSPITFILCIMCI